MLTSRFCPTCNTRSLASYAAKPAAVTATLYPGAGVSAGAAKSPASLVRRVREMPLSSLVITILALGTTEPVGSRTTPEIPASPPADCANAEAPRSMQSVTAFKDIANLRSGEVQDSEYI